MAQIVFVFGKSFKKLSLLKGCLHKAVGFALRQEQGSPRAVGGGPPGQDSDYGLEALSEQVKNCGSVSPAMDHAATCATNMRPPIEKTFNL